MKKCLDCNKPKSRKGFFCKSCGYKHRKRPSGLKYSLKKKNSTWFKKGVSSWNKGKKYKNPRMSAIHKGKHHSPSTEFKKGNNIGKKNNNWKGDRVGYFALHSWVYRKLGKPEVCEFCGSTGKMQWANKSWEYKRDMNDWLSLCSRCHRNYDKQNWGTATERFSL